MTKTKKRWEAVEGSSVWLSEQARQKADIQFADVIVDQSTF